MAENLTVEMTVTTAEQWPGEPQRQVPSYCYALLTAFMTCTTLCSVTLNAIVVIVTLKSKKLRKPINSVMVNLSVVDFLSALIGGPIAIMANAKGHFFFNKLVCIAYGFILGVLGVTNLITIVVLSVSRLLIVFYQSSFSFTADRAKIGIGIAWAWSLIWHVPPLFWGGYGLEGIGTSCAPNYNYESTLGLIFLSSYFMFCFFLPLVVMGTSYVLLLISLRRTQRNSTVRCDIQKANEQRSMKMVAIVTIAFLVCWSPYAIVSIYTLISNTELDMYVTTFPAYFAKAAGIYNPIIYFLMNERFRREVLDVLIFQQSTVNINSVQNTDSAPPVQN